jgi:hypothetical protein
MNVIASIIIACFMVATCRGDDRKQGIRVAIDAAPEV